MPNWIHNMIYVDDNAFFNEIINQHCIKRNPKNVFLFDFNTIEKRPEDLQIKWGFDSADLVLFFLRGIVLPDYCLKFIQGDRQTAVQRKKRLIQRGYSEAWIAGNRPVRSMDNRTIELAQKYYLNFRNYGSFSWYDWCISHWGTKWNACHSKIESTVKTILFDTAWSPPFPVIKKRSALHVGRAIYYKYIDEERNFLTCKRRFINGIRVKQEAIEKHNR